MSWGEVELNDLCDLKNGYAFKSKDYVKLSNTYSCRMSNIRPGGEFNLDYNARYLPDSFADQHSQFLLKDGDVIIAMTDLAGSPKILGVPTVVKTNGKNVLLNQRVGKLKIKDNNRVFFPYLKFALNDPKIRIIYRKFAGGGLQINLGKTDLLSVKIPLPPLKIQKHIAAVLEKADQLRKDCQQMEQELNQLAQSVFIDMFGDPVTNPKGWDLVSLSSLVSDFQGGKSIVAADDESTSYKNRVLKISAVTSGKFKPYESKPLPNDYSPPVEHFVQKGNLLFSRANTAELVGATTFLFKGYDNLLLPDKLWKFIWKDKLNVSPIFIWQLLSNDGVRKQISRLSTGSGGSMKNISKAKLNTLKIPLPPIKLQQKYEQFYLSLKSSYQDNSEQFNYVSNLFNALSQKAFKGELKAPT